MLYQTVRSSLCAIYATANLLELYGFGIDRTEARRLFGFAARGRVFVTRRSQISRVVGRQLGRPHVRWRSLQRFSITRAAQALRHPFLRGAPAMLTLSIRHRHREWYGVHCMVAIGVSEAGLHVIDSLGRRSGNVPNAVISRHGVNGSWPIEGTPLLATRGRMSVLLGLPTTTLGS